MQQFVRIMQEIERNSIMRIDGKDGFDIHRLGSLLAEKSLEESARRFPDLRAEHGCKVNYCVCSQEFFMLTLTMISLAYILDLMWKKTANGHCNNDQHGAAKGDKDRQCPLGSQFHNKLYKEFIELVGQVYKLRTDTPPKVLH